MPVQQPLRVFFSVGEPSGDLHGANLIRELRAQYPGCVFVVRITAQRIFPNCPRYLHRMQLVEHSAHAPRPGYTPPVPAWKSFEAFRDALPARDRGDGPPE